MRYPKFLPEGGTIGFVAPSFGCSSEPYKSGFMSAQETFKSMGYKVELGPNCYAADGVGISNTPQKCAEELTEYYCKKSNDVLISCGGGELMCEDLDYLDFDKIAKADPKWYMGYSDNTNMTFLLTTIWDTASIYAPCAPSFGMKPWHPAIEDTFRLLTGQNLKVHGYDRYEKESLKDKEHPLEPYNVTEPRIMVKYPDKDAHMEGRLIGGCLDVMVVLVGTKFDQVQKFTEKYKDDGFIWFIEACDLNTVAVRRALWQIEQAGWFRYLKGFLIGRPMHHGESYVGVDQYEAVTGILGKYNVPILMDLDIGHVPPVMPLICGSYAKVDAVGNNIEIEMQLK